MAVNTIHSEQTVDSSDTMHKVAAGLSGAIGGAFGLGALIIELPVSTGIIFRSIADIAQSHGEQLSAVETRLACLEVFALGGRAPGSGTFEGGYFAVHLSLAKALSEAASYITERGLAGEAAPAVVRYVSLIASRFGLVVTEKAAAFAVPLIGAATGAAINTLFMNHFQDIAHGHFIVRSLERKYGTEEVQKMYEAIGSRNLKCQSSL